ncbi:MAG: hypothetical protein J2P58_12855 [Acidimicrobiaceae bacterium]|nr:hypothetical protein [Acidimicrobiaceae bacterium]
MASLVFRDLVAELQVGRLLLARPSGEVGLKAGGKPARLSSTVNAGGTTIVGTTLYKSARQ